MALTTPAISWPRTVPGGASWLARWRSLPQIPQPVTRQDHLVGAWLGLGDLRHLEMGTLFAQDGGSHAAHLTTPRAALPSCPSGRRRATPRRACSDDARLRVGRHPVAGAMTDDQVAAGEGRQAGGRSPHRAYIGGPHRAVPGAAPAGLRRDLPLLALIEGEVAKNALDVVTVLPELSDDDRRFLAVWRAHEAAHSTIFDAVRRTPGLDAVEPRIPVQVRALLPGGGATG